MQFCEAESTMVQRPIWNLRAWVQVPNRMELIHSQDQISLVIHNFRLVKEINPSCGTLRSLFIPSLLLFKRNDDWPILQTCCSYKLQLYLLFTCAHGLIMFGRGPLGGCIHPILFSKISCFVFCILNQLHV